MQETITKYTDGIGIPPVVTATRIQKVELLNVQKRDRTPPASWANRRDWRSHESKPRIYPSVRGETLWENLARRRTSPIREYRKFIPAVLKELGLPPETKVRWSQKAGCSMCPCSPGFIVETQGRWDAWMIVGDRTAA